MSDDRRDGPRRMPRDPMGRPYDPYRGHDERGRVAPDGERRGAADDGYRWDERTRRDHDTDQFRARDRGHLGDWDWRRARRGEVEGDYGRAYGNRDNATYHRDDQYGPQRSGSAYGNPGDPGHGLRQDDRRYATGPRHAIDRADRPPRRRDR